MLSRTFPPSRRTSKPRNPGRAAVGGEQRREDPDGGRLARAVRTQQAEDGSGLDVEVDSAEGVDIAVALAQSFGLDGGVDGHLRNLSKRLRAEPQLLSLRATTSRYS
jgi:hypothetical protein